MSSEKIPGVKVVRKPTSDGVKLYYYHRETMMRLPDDPTSTAFADAVKRCNREREREIAEAKAETISTLIRAYKASTEWTKLAESTRSVEKFNIDAIESEFGDMPLAKVEAKGARRLFIEWRNDIAEEHPRAADAKMKRLAKMFAFACDIEMMARHPLLKVAGVYSADRSEFVWSDAQIERVLAVSNETMRLAITLALHTGQRRGDLLVLTWRNYDGQALSLRQSKTGAYVYVPCTRELKLALDLALTEAVGDGTVADVVDRRILLSEDGEPWTADAFRSNWRRAWMRSGLNEDLHFADLRGTAITRLAEAGCTIPEIATISGHSLATVTKILETYLKRSNALSLSAIAKLQKTLDAVRKGEEEPIAA